MKRKVRNIFLIIIIVILSIMILLPTGMLIGQYAGLAENTAYALTFDKVGTQESLVPVKDEDGIWTFTTDDTFKTLQITDVHLGGSAFSIAEDKKAMNAIAAMVAVEKPDLIVVTGDMVFPMLERLGSTNNRLTTQLFIDFMENLGVYWTVVLGNHESEGNNVYSFEQISEMYANPSLKYCLYQDEYKEVYGNGHHYIQVKNTSGVLTRAFIFMDTHAYADDYVPYINWTYDYIRQEQVDWYASIVKKLQAKSANVKTFVFTHIGIEEYRTAWYEFRDNGFKDTDNVKYIFGLAGEKADIVYPGGKDSLLFETAAELGSTQGFFCGHDHLNNFSVEYKGIRLTYGKSIDYYAYLGIKNTAQHRGCTAIFSYADGSFDITQHSYYEEIDGVERYPSKYEKEEGDWTLFYDVPTGYQK